jgi:hypothetical protein
MDDAIWKETERATGMTIDERLREGFRLFEQGRNYIVNTVGETFPDATPEEVERIRDIVLRSVRRWGIT